MKTRNHTTVKNKGKWMRKILFVTATALLFSYLYSRGLSPVWLAVAIVFFKGLFRFIYAIACLLVTLAILAAILGCLIF